MCTHTYILNKKDKTNHIALYIQKFIAADYLAGIQIQTHISFSGASDAKIRRVTRERERVGD